MAPTTCRHQDGTYEPTTVPGVSRLICDRDGTATDSYLTRCTACREGYVPRPTTAHPLSQSPWVACPQCQGFGRVVCDATGTPTN
jgi:DnaJ-class molecular chaperone